MPTSGKRGIFLVGGCPSWEEISSELRAWAEAKGYAKAVSRIPTTVSSEVAKPSLGAPPPHVTPYDCSRAENILGIKFKGTKEMVHGTVQSLVSWGILSED